MRMFYPHALSFEIFIRTSVYIISDLRMKFWNTEILNLSLVRKVLIIINIFRYRKVTIRNFSDKKSMIFFTIIDF